MNVALELGCRNNLGIAVGRVKVLKCRIYPEQRWYRDYVVLFRATFLF